MTLKNMGEKLIQSCTTKAHLQWEISLQSNKNWLISGTWPGRAWKCQTGAAGIQLVTKTRPIELYHEVATFHPCLDALRRSSSTRWLSTAFARAVSLKPSNRTLSCLSNTTGSKKSITKESCSRQVSKRSSVSSIRKLELTRDRCTQLSKTSI